MSADTYFVLANAATPKLISRIANQSFRERDKTCQIVILCDYANREKTLMSKPVGDDLAHVQIQKGVIVENSAQAQNYTKFKKGQTRAGEIPFVLFRPDFASPTVEKCVRRVIENGWCDAIIGLEHSPKKDGLQKKNHLVTQVEAKLMAQNNISLFFDRSSLIDQDVVPFILNRISQLKHVGRRFFVSQYCVSLIQSNASIFTAKQLREILDVL